MDCAARWQPNTAFPAAAAHLNGTTREVDMRALKPQADRFWAKVEKSDGCWLWTRSRHKFGYGYLRTGSVTLLAHRVSYELNVGPIPAGMHVLHSCDNPPCVNPDHLHLGTQADNMRECQERGRTPRGDHHSSRTHPSSVPRGESHSASKLSVDAVLEIRRLHGDGVTTGRTLAQRFGVTEPTICDVVYRRSWKHL